MKIIEFINYLKISYYRGYYLVHRNIFKKIIFEVEGIDIDNIQFKFKEVKNRR